MCSCEWNYVCPRCKGTPEDPAYLDLCDDREKQQERVYGSDGSKPDEGNQ